MKTNYTFLLLLLIAFTSYAQDQKFSVEVNYPLGITKGDENFTGIADANIKYRFAEGGLFQYGASFTFDYLKSEITSSDSNVVLVNEGLGSEYYFFHLNGFAEMTIPSAEKIHPFVGGGFTYVGYELEYYSPTDDFTTIMTRKEKDPGFNLKLGIQYDITSSFFIQSYFHYIRTFNKSEINDESNAKSYNQVKLGVGLRF